MKKPTKTLKKVIKKAIHQDNVPHGVGYKVKVLSQLLGRALQDKLNPYGLTPPHWLVLNCLWREDGMPINQLVDKLQQVGGTMTGVIDRMEERNLVVRTRDKVDRRMWRVWLTDKGRQLQQELPPLVSRMRLRLINGIAVDDYECFMRVLDDLIVNASSMGAL